MSTRWLNWNEHPLLARSNPQFGLTQLCDRLAALSCSHSDFGKFASVGLPQIGTYFNVQWAGIAERTPPWRVISEHGIRSRSGLPVQLMDEALDRDAAGYADLQGEVSVAIPFAPGDHRVLCLSGGRMTESQLPELQLVGKIFAHAASFLGSAEKLTRRLDRLRATLEIARTFASAREPQELLELIAHEATRLLGSDRASIFLWDRDQKQLVACPALGVEGGKLWLPDNRGIVGQVIQTGETVRVDDAYADSRFDKSVDTKSGYRTRTLLCVPLVNAAKHRIGAFELINKNEGIFTDDDEEALYQLGIQVAVAIENAQERDLLLRSNRQLTERVTGSSTIIGESPSIQAMRGTIERLAATDLPVLVTGESGTGKEVAAQALHYRGPRSGHPFIAVNCAALTETLLESELFGHEKGAFTDAHATHIGKFELAQGGTLFLDEIGDMSPGGQAKLLRVLEQKVITRVGGTQSIPVNVRVVAATNANLTEMVREKKFRQDLYYRLSVVTVEIPPLRDRPEDVMPLAEHFLTRFCRQANRPKLHISDEARKRIQGHTWPGNVRELRNLMERVAFLSAGKSVEASDLAFILSPQKDSFQDLADGYGLAEATDRFQQEYIKRAIKRVQSNMSEAARVLGLHRSNLYRKMRQLGMEVDESKE